MSVAQLIDHTILKPSTSPADVEKICGEAAQYGFAAVCVPPYFVEQASQILTGGKPGVATVIGFPFGYSHFNAKLEEAQQALADGANELDMVMNIAAFKSNDLAWLETEIDLITKAAREKKALVKVIIESGILSEEEIVTCCELYRQFPVDFLKTSTGYAEKGVSLEAVRLMRKHLPSSIQIKASGGIKSLEFAEQLLKAGATRLGCSASIAILNEEKGMASAPGSGY